MFFDFFYFYLNIKDMFILCRFLVDVKFVFNLFVFFDLEGIWFIKSFYERINCVMIIISEKNF